LLLAFYELELREQVFDVSAINRPPATLSFRRCTKSLRKPFCSRAAEQVFPLFPNISEVLRLQQQFAPRPVRSSSAKARHVTDALSTVRFERAALALQIRTLLARLHPTVTFERRCDDRLSIPLLFRLTPLAEDGQPMADHSITVVGKDISRYGLSFYHAAPLPYRRAWISVENAEFAAFAAEIDIHWCRFSKPGWYESGSRLIAAMPAESVAATSRQGSYADDRSGPGVNRRTA
jgi:hypothetical protein